MNIRPPKTVSEEFLEVQDAYLQEECRRKGVVSLSDISLAQPGIYLWQGDITRLSVDAIVNAANSAMLGCFVPCHGCIDNVIHSAAGVELRLECYRSCLELAAAYQLKTIAFCCISTGEFHFPNEKAAAIAIQTVQDYQRKNQNGLEVVFNVFKDSDYQIYKQLLG